ncbi:MAG: DUF481 domain-containing protein, partial [Gammaproteobacteria bacterium]|nr:DUF481 domain-containing protein [Gammaproteobacteria bacterium]
MQRFFLITIFFLSFSPMQALAIINIEDLRLSALKEGMNGQLTLGLDGKSGNSENFTTSINSQTQWFRTPNTYMLTMNLEYGESFGRENTNNHFLHMRRVHDLSDYTAWEAFGQWEQDKFARVNYRALSGGGARLRLAEPDQDYGIILGLGGFYSEEQVSADANLADSGVNSLWRANIYLALKKRWGDSIFAGATTYFQPAIADTEDFRAMHEA